jgi:predicted deacetylase
MQQGVFLFTLDTEFAWGHYDIFDPRLFSSDGSRERQTVARISEMLDEFKITATWAIVGHLFCKDYFSCRDIDPVNWGSKYPRFHKLVVDNHPLLYAPDLIEMLIKRGACHEIGFHGFSHRIFPEMSESEARTEIEAWLRVAAPYAIQPKTVVFPRNRIKHLSIFKEYGFICYRGEEKYPGLAASPSYLGKALRRYYRYASLVATPEIYLPVLHQSGLLNIPASRSLFAVDRVLEGWLRRINVRGAGVWAIVRGIHQAGVQNRVFHLYTHPFEFRSEDDFDKLRRIFTAVRQEMEHGRLISCSMKQLAEMALN